MAFSPDGTMLVTAGRDHDAVVWDVASGTPIRRLEKHFGSVVDARFSPDGRWIVTAGPTTAGLWSASDGRFLGYLRGPTTLLTAAAFEPGSRALRTREEDGTVRRYACQLCGGLDELVELARKRVAATGRVLGDEQRARYLE